MTDAEKQKLRDASRKERIDRYVQCSLTSLASMLLLESTKLDQACVNVEGILPEDGSDFFDADEHAKMYEGRSHCDDLIEALVIHSSNYKPILERLKNIIDK